MPTQAEVRHATSRQLEYIKRLQKEAGSEDMEISDEVSSLEASRIISELISKAQRNGNLHYLAKRINEPRLGMAIKECFRIWKTNGWDIYSKHRKAFIKEAIKTYNLFTEITEALHQASGHLR
jgi:hypothetical protein